MLSSVSSIQQRFSKENSKSIEMHAPDACTLWKMCFQAWSRGSLSALPDASSEM